MTTTKTKQANRKEPITEQLCYKAENIFNCSPNQVHYKMHPGGTVTINLIFFFFFPAQRANSTAQGKKSEVFYIKCVCTTRDKRRWSFFRVSLESWGKRRSNRSSVFSFKYCAKTLCKALKLPKTPIREGSSQRKVLAQNLSYGETAKQGTASTVKH